MTEATDLWGDFGTEPLRTPLTILKEQGALLERKTNGILTVNVKTETLSHDFYGEQSNYTAFTHHFDIKSPSLNYSYRLFSIYQPIEIFPVKFEGEALGVKSETVLRKYYSHKIANNEEEFLETLKEVLQSSKTQKIIGSLLSQSSGT